MNGGIDDKRVDDDGIDVVASLSYVFFSYYLDGVVVLKIYQWRWHGSRAPSWMHVERMIVVTRVLLFK
jgi:hypothetical protein